MRVVIIGITGQDGFYLTKILNHMKMEIIGTTRNVESKKSEFFQKNFPNIKLVQIDFCNLSEVTTFVPIFKPDAIVNLAGPSSVRQSFLHPERVWDETVNPILNIFSCYSRKESENLHFLQASSSEIFGGESQNLIISENSKFSPLNPYANAKVAAYKILQDESKVKNARITNLFMFNHESPMREETYVSQKLISGLVKYKYKQIKRIEVGNLSQKRDWSFAGDFMDAVSRIIRENKSGDFVLASGVLHEIFEIAVVAHRYLKIETSLENILQFNLSETRSIEPSGIMGDNRKIRAELSWSPTVSFEELIISMVDAQISKLINPI